ncbi:ABC transporter ATP-binding protein [Streptomyces rishiriensis]|uniref:ABC transporter ATP-binding protein n=1 Tax=Streptomyces rishiriensis TaxID=68264 RepID=UPI0037BDDE57
MTTTQGILKALRLTWRASRGGTCVLALLTLVSAVTPVAAAWLTKSLLDLLAHGGGAQRGQVVLLAAGLAAAGLFTGCLPQLLMYANKEFERAVGLLAQQQLYEATGRLVGLARFEDPAFVDRLRLAQQHGGATPGVLVATILSVVRAVAMAGGFLGSLLLLAWWLPAVVVVSVVPVLASEMWLAKRRVNAYWQIGPTERREIFYRELLTNLQAVKEIRLFDIGGQLCARMTREKVKANSVRARLDRQELGAQTLAGLVTASSAGAAVIWAVLAALSGRISLGDVSLMMASVAGVQSAGSGLMRDIAKSHQQLLMFRHYLSIVDGAPDLPVPQKPSPVPALSSGIEFRDVWFRYSPEHPWALRGVSFRLGHGRCLALVGRNGAGKSTIVKLLCRMYDPERGAILWDGVDLRELDPPELRRRIGAVFQDYMTYDLSAYENIALGDLPNASPERVTEAAQRSGADTFVRELPRGYDTLLSRIFFQGDEEDGDGDRGVTLSGGQWQRLAIARAYLRGRQDLLILDEPSSGLDAETEARIHRQLREYRGSRTSVLISHRLGSVREADELLVVDDGEVAEQGTHDELIAHGGLYAGMFAAQAEGYQSRTAEPVANVPGQPVEARQ